MAILLRREGRRTWEWRSTSRSPPVWTRARWIRKGGVDRGGLGGGSGSARAVFQSGRYIESGRASRGRGSRPKRAAGSSCAPGHPRLSEHSDLLSRTSARVLGMLTWAPRGRALFLDQRDRRRPTACRARRRQGADLRGRPRATAGPYRSRHLQSVRRDDGNDAAKGGTPARGPPRAPGRVDPATPAEH